MDKIKVVIIDDESLARDLIKHYLSSRQDVEICGECSNGFEGIKMIQLIQPDLLFLDIQMPKITGFEMLEIIENPPAIIFTTAYDQYALKAFEMHAIDYLLKPFAQNRFYESLDKAISQIYPGLLTTVNYNDIAIDISNASDIPLNRIVIKNGSDIKVISSDQVDFIEAQDDYVMIYTSENRFLKQQTMKHFETQLDAQKFVRIHRSFIVNIRCINKLEKYTKDSYHAILNSGKTLKVSQTGYKKLKAILNF